MLAGRALRSLVPSVASVAKCSAKGRPVPAPLRCNNSTSAAASKSIFDQEEAAWEQVFKDINPSPERLLASTSIARTGARAKRRPQTLTASEAQTFDRMFNTLFNSIENLPKSQVGRTLSPVTGVGRTRTDMDGFIDIIQSRRPIKWTSEADQELDRKKEEMDLCNTDQELLEWAVREVFGESQRYEEAARNAASSSSSSPSAEDLQPPSYPHLIAELMRKFRDKYSDPHLSLAVFDYARNLSIASFVFGCTTPAYNELIETRWRCFRDLRGVCDALEEMRVNGVGMDTRTRALAETVRQEVGQRNLWEEETSIGSGDVWVMLRRIEKLTAGPRSTENPSRRPKKWSKSSETWRSHALQSEATDTWEFGQWDDAGPQLV
ncbi:hypothetical protein EIP86_005815 [Pleurotus ostreatoroseus]|nr:hypothetical protein EIP86_005815 [Pleurotus ostreatoroseus]